MIILNFIPLLVWMLVFFWIAPTDRTGDRRFAESIGTHYILGIILWIVVGIFCTVIRCMYRGI